MANHLIPSQQINSVARNILDFYPRPNVGRNLFTTTQVQENDNNQFGAPAVKILKQLRASASESDFVFPAARSKGQAHVSKYDLTKATEHVRERTGIYDFVAHDLHRTAASEMTSMGISPLTVSKILNHVEPGVTAVYDRYSYDREKRDALEAWAQRLQVIISRLREVGGGGAKVSDTRAVAEISTIATRSVD